MNVLSIFGEGLLGGLRSMLTLSLIILPLMISMEIAKDINLIDKISKALSPLTRFMGISEKSAFPLAVGMIIGLAYGAGVIIQSAKDGDLDKRSLVLISIFLVCCHAVIEDTLLFVAIGANGVLLLSIRVITALVLTIFISRKIMIKDLDMSADKICEKHIH